MDAAEEFNVPRETTNHAQVPNEERKDLIHPAEEKEKIVTAQKPSGNRRRFPVAVEPKLDHCSEGCIRRWK